MALANDTAGLLDVVAGLWLQYAELQSDGTLPQFGKYTTMPNVFTACWCMSESIFNEDSARLDDLQNVVLTADTTLKIMARSTGAVDHTRLFIVPEYYFAAGGGLASRSGKHDIYKRLTAISAMVPDLIFIAGTIAYQKGTFSTSVYSVCPVLHDGEIVKKIYKADDDGFYEDNGTFKSKTDNGKGVPVFTIDGLTVGVDICMDYNNERLLTYLQEEGLEAPDIHVQISGSNATSATRAVARDGGIYVHCDLGGKALNGASAYRVNGRDAVAADTNRIQPDQIQLPGAGGRLMYFTTPV